MPTTRTPARRRIRATVLQPVLTRAAKRRANVRTLAAALELRCAACGASLSSHVGTGNRWKGCPAPVARFDAQAALDRLTCTRCGDPVRLHVPAKAPDLGCPRNTIANRYASLTPDQRRTIDAAIAAMTPNGGR